MTKVKCPNCQFANPPGQENCVRCRTPLPRVNIQPQAASGAPEPGAGVSGAIQVRRGQIIANRYTALDIVGRGGMGCIYKVRDNTLGEEVALKMLLPQFVQDKIVVDRFLNEARIARQLSHPNIVRVHDIGIAGSVLYISMEFLKGSSLRGLLDAQAPGQRLPLRKVLDIFDQLCSALEYAHQYTVHRDLKPENVMIIEDGTVKLMDFGISKLMSNYQLTSASMVMGTPYYMSPEQLKDSRNVDARADIYSLGVMLYEILTGNLPTGVPKAASQLRQDLPPALDPIVETCVDPDPAKRYQNIMELRNALLPVKAMVDSGAGAKTIASAVGRAPASGGRNARKLAGVLLLAVVIGASVWGLSRAEKRRASNAAAVVVAPDPAKDEPAEVATIPNKDEFSALSDLVDQAASKAKVKAKTLSSPAVSDILDRGGFFWKSAQKDASREDFSQALADRRKALQCYLGIVLQATKYKDMVFIPPSDMVLADPEKGRSGKIRLNGFLIDKTEVTNQEYVNFLGGVKPVWRPPRYLEAGMPPEIAECPVVRVTFYDAQAYAAWAGKSLPTEAQWAMAAYGAFGDSGLYPWGDNAKKTDAANVGGGDSGSTDAPCPVTSFQDEGQDVTTSGCIGMEGNVSEWTRSECSDSLPFPYDAKDGREDQQAFNFGTSLAVRGSNFRGGLQPLSWRFSAPYETKADTIGFRCVVEIPSGRNLDEVAEILQNS
ncbi:MAG: SUMF1/EgtB/PvdO family nonheme iron enzyme [Candidatus Hydrogenedentes bacterium]|nr:SUMF1/EgtB/PvdO family nonheme iron enzyme [Candidatus Hydrogenedentota bacterium]